MLRTGTIIGLSEVEVGGVDVEVLTFELHDEISGASTGTNERVVKVLPDTGLIVELSVAVDVQNDSPIGDVHYLELYRLRCVAPTSLTLERCESQRGLGGRRMNRAVAATIRPATNSTARAG